MQIRKFTIVALILIGLISMVVPNALAQEGDSNVNTITVTGTGSSEAAPDMATLSVGVELSGENILTVYGEVNSAISNVMTALEALGITDEDMRTAGLDVYVNPVYMGEGQPARNETRVSNRVNITIRDLTQIETVIDTAINNGANSIFGLQFGLSDNSTLESEARTAALSNARSRAEEIASNLGVSLGSVVSVIELSGGNYPFAVTDNAMIGGGSGAVIEPGRVSITMSVQVTYRFDS